MRQKAVIIDIDGTLSNSPHVEGFKKPTGGTDWEAWIASTRYAPVNEWCKELVLAMHRRGYKLIFLTARSTNFSGLEITKEWLDSHLNHEGIFEYELIMRPIGDFRPDTEVKTMLYSTLISPYYDVLFAIDDKKTVINLWRSLSVPALHCADY
jgi:FMN phosphatase YigB (HAD superfamily)